MARQIKYPVRKYIRLSEETAIKLDQRVAETGIKENVILRELVNEGLGKELSDIRYTSAPTIEQFVGVLKKMDTTWHDSTDAFRNMNRALKILAINKKGWAKK